MKVIFFIFLLKILLPFNEAADNATSEEFNNPYEDEYILWRHLFIKVNTILLETNKRQHEQAKQMNDILKEIREIKTEFQNVQNEQDRKFTVILKEIEGVKNEFKNVQHEQERQMNENLKQIQNVQHEQDRKIEEISESIDGVNEAIVEHFEEQKLEKSFKMVANDGSIWTTIARRMDGSVDFYKNWAEYKAGFGNPPFIGLEKLHLLTTAVPHVELKIVIRSWDNEERYAIYDGFQIGNETEKYQIKLLGACSGTAGDAMRIHDGQHFTTFDEDNDGIDKGNCAKFYEGAWWFSYCCTSHLFGPYRQKEDANTTGITWYNFDWKSRHYSFKYVEMLLRPKV
ncbi:ficolin-2-like isoform X1 [Musca autumnalis]|uniref:ficolin-2-like isoform X1 n=2 Tax=Musca autumnalis TaxID=221902 RepID=UPI003CE81B1D